MENQEVSQIEKESKISPETLRIISKINLIGEKIIEVLNKNSAVEDEANNTYSNTYSQKTVST